MSETYSDPTRAAAPLERREAESIAAEIRTLHPDADALVLYAFGRGGYGIVARSPLPGQDDVLLLSRGAYRTFAVLRGDAWLRAWDGKSAQESMAQRAEASAVAALLLQYEREGR